MSNLTREELIRAWRDDEFRATLSEDQLAQLKEIPEALSELTEEELEMIAGGADKCNGTCGNDSCTGNTQGNGKEIEDPTPSE